jgi:hypothetical protein
MEQNGAIQYVVNGKTIIRHLNREKLSGQIVLRLNAVWIKSVSLTLLYDCPTFAQPQHRKIKIKNYPYNQFWESSTYFEDPQGTFGFVRSVAVVELRGVGYRLFSKVRQCAAKLVTEMGAKGFDHEMSQELGKSTRVKERKITNIRTVLLLF